MVTIEQSRLEGRDTHMTQSNIHNVTTISRRPLDSGSGETGEAERDPMVIPQGSRNAK